MGIRKHGRHQTVNRDFVRPLRRIENQPGVKKVLLGPFTNARHRFSPGTVRVVGAHGTAVKLKAYCGDGFQVVTVIFDKPVPLNEVEHSLTRS